jgi:hypothetical protein
VRARGGSVKPAQTRQDIDGLVRPQGKARVKSILEESEPAPLVCQKHQIGIAGTTASAGRVSAVSMGEGE